MTRMSFLNSAELGVRDQKHMLVILLLLFFLLTPVNVFMFLQARAGIDYESSFGKVRANDTILKLQRTTPYYKRNRAHVCSFYVRGQCTRGLECPYRHEMPVTGELSQQNIKDRYYGYGESLLFSRI